MHSRHSARAFAAVQHGLVARGFSLGEVHAAPGRRALRKRVRGALRAGYRLVIVGGGDGSLASVVGELAHEDAVLGVVPLGTGNSFAHSLGLPLDLEAALDVIAGGRVARVDLGCVNGTYFANFATVGLSSVIADRTPHLLKEVFGTVAYGLAGIGPLLAHPSFACTVRWSGNALKLRTQQVLVANGRFFGVIPVVPQAHIDDGRLGLFVRRAPNGLAALRTFAAMARGRHSELPGSHFFSARKIEIEADPRQSLAIDGAALGRTPAHFSVARSALRVMVPAGSSLP
jgi:YegS/Rv2252/BmrU family lipid kinase